MDIMEQPGTSSDNTVALLIPDVLLSFWPQVKVVMEKHPTGLLDGWYTLEEVFKLILTGRLQLWIGYNDSYVVEAVQLTRIEEYDKFKICRIVWMGGKYKPYYRQNLSSLEGYCKYLKVDRLAFDGRPGLVKRAEKLGFKPVRVEMWKQVEVSH